MDLVMNRLFAIGFLLGFGLSAQEKAPAPKLDFTPSKIEIPEIKSDLSTWLAIPAIIVGSDLKRNKDDQQRRPEQRQTSFDRLAE
jgi:hypothetical protein